MSCCSISKFLSQHWQKGRRPDRAGPRLLRFQLNWRTLSHSIAVVLPYSGIGIGDDGQKCLMSSCTPAVNSSNPLIRTWADPSSDSRACLRTMRCLSCTRSLSLLGYAYRCALVCHQNCTAVFISTRNNLFCTGICLAQVMALPQFPLNVLGSVLARNRTKLFAPLNPGDMLVYRCEASFMAVSFSCDNAFSLGNNLPGWTVIT